MGAGSIQALTQSTFSTHTPGTSFSSFTPLTPLNASEVIQPRQQSGPCSVPAKSEGDGKVWLPEKVIPGFRDFMVEFYWECHKLTQEILRAIAEGLGIENPDTFLKPHSGLNNQLRLLHYPPIPADEIETGAAVRMLRHSDWSSITMLFRGDYGSLQVENSEVPDQFVPATSVVVVVAVNVGDLLTRWSNDRLKSTTHRLTLPPILDRLAGTSRMTRERYSIPCFAAPDPDAMVGCLPGCSDEERPAKCDPVTRRDYCAMREKSQYPK